VLARETSREDLRRLCSGAPYETEVFVHGALCVSQSGGCLFSSLVGGRSGNRGECAQPCRLPYSLCDAKGARAGKTRSFPLSLRDLSLAGHVAELIDMGITSFKIEGRMKSPEYVRDTAKIWRRLIDENRNATQAEIAELAGIFSRGGFTDGYFTGKKDGNMLGIRSEDDKKQSRGLVPFSGLERKIPVTFKAEIRRGTQSVLRVLPHGISVSGEIPREAINSPLTSDAVAKNLSKLGGTPYFAESVEVALDGGLNLSPAEINALRRAAIEALQPEVTRSDADFAEAEPPANLPAAIPARTAVFYNPAGITDAAREYFDLIFTPVESYNKKSDGVFLPPVIFDSERERILACLETVKKEGASHILVGNVGQIELAQNSGLIPHGDFRFNISNKYSLKFLLERGLHDAILSPELTLPQIRGFVGTAGVIVYGRIPLMYTERCFIKDAYGCAGCEKSRPLELTDRMGVKFPVLPDAARRNTIFNSLPTCMSDRQDDLNRANVLRRHFIFTVESPSEVDAVIAAHKKGTPLPGQVRRIK